MFVSLCVCFGVSDFSVCKFPRCFAAYSDTGGKQQHMFGQGFVCACVFQYLALWGDHASPSKETLWLETEQRVIEGRVVALPKGERCQRHGRVSMAWPLLPWPDFANMYQTVRAFRDAVDTACDRMASQRLDTLPECSVHSMQRQGLRVFCEYLVFAVEDLQKQHPAH